MTTRGVTTITSREEAVAAFGEGGLMTRAADWKADITPSDFYQGRVSNAAMNPTEAERAAMVGKWDTDRRFLTPDPYADPGAQSVEEVAAAMLAAGGITRDQALTFAKARVENEDTERRAEQKRIDDPYVRHRKLLDVRFNDDPAKHEEHMAWLTARNDKAYRRAAFSADTVPDKRDTERPHVWECNEDLEL